MSAQKKERKINIEKTAQTELVSYLKAVVNGDGNINQAPAVTHDLTIGDDDELIDMTSGDGDDEEDDEEDGNEGDGNEGDDGE